MPKCIICDDKFTEWPDPPEDCACGQRISPLAAITMTAEEIHKARENWELQLARMPLDIYES